MNTLNWKEIWNRRSFSAEEKLSLDTLIKLDGFDSGAGRIAADDWQTYADIISEKLNINILWGAIVTLLGVFLVNYSMKKPKEEIIAEPEQ